MSFFSKPILYFVHVLFSFKPLAFHFSILAILVVCNTIWVTYTIWSNGKWPNSYTDFQKKLKHWTQKLPKTPEKTWRIWAARHPGQNLAGKLFQVDGGGLNIISWITMEPEQKLTMFGVLIQVRFSVICVSYVVTCFSSCLRVRPSPKSVTYGPYPPWNSHFRPWKWMVGIRSFPIGEAYFQGQTC